MRKADLSPDRQACLVRCTEHANCYALVPPPTPRLLADLDATTQAQLQRAHEALGALRAASVSVPNTALITRTLARREAVQSSQIEGTRTKLPELLEYEATQGADGTGPDVAVVERYLEALDLGLEALREHQGRHALNCELVRAMHKVLLQDAPDHYRPGEYRLNQAWIGGGRIEDATFVPPPPAAIPPLMDELEGSMLQYAPREDEVAILSIVTQIALAHAQFETIHPFVDGNGRVGRLIMPLMLASEGYPPLYLSGFLLRFRRGYYDALAGVQLRGEWAAWVRFLCAALIESARTSVKIAQDLNAIHDAWVQNLSDLRSDAAARKLPSLLLARPVVTVSQIADLLGISFVAANKAVQLLVERGILSEPERRRNRIFHATQLLGRLERP